MKSEVGTYEHFNKVVELSLGGSTTLDLIELANGGTISYMVGEEKPWEVFKIVVAGHHCVPVTTRFRSIEEALDILLDDDFPIIQEPLGCFLFIELDIDDDNNRSAEVRTRSLDFEKAEMVESETSMTLAINEQYKAPEQ
jgi:hypothetical protein